MVHLQTRTHWLVSSLVISWSITEVGCYHVCHTSFCLMKFYHRSWILITNICSSANEFCWWISSLICFFLDEGIVVWYLSPLFYYFGNMIKEPLASSELQNCWKEDNNLPAACKLDTWFNGPILNHLSGGFTISDLLIEKPTTHLISHMVAGKNILAEANTSHQKMPTNGTCRVQF